VELEAIAARFAEGLPAVDASTQRVSANRRTGELYLPGVKTLVESNFVDEFVDWWKASYRSDFNPPNAIDTEVPYPGIARARCDLILSTEGSNLSQPEWSIEVKHIALVGNNGKNNDFGVAKILSPYLKDRSLIHDIRRMRDYGIGKRKAVIGYCFDYDKNSCEEAGKKHPNQQSIIENLIEVCLKNDPINGTYGVQPLIQYADKIFQSEKLVKPLVSKKFNGAWRHPCGGTGTIFAWEII
jgi:hypothetical protein